MGHLLRQSLTLLGRLPHLTSAAACSHDDDVASLPLEAQEIEVTIPKHPEAVAAAVGAVGLPGFDSKPTVVKLTKKKGDQYAEREDDRNDRWKVGEQLAQADKVTELLEALTKLDAKTPADRTDDGKPPAEFAKLDGFTVRVTAQAKAADGDAAPAPRTFTLALAARDAAKKKLAVSVAGWPRVSFVDDAVVALAERGPLAYRSRRLFDTAEMKLDTLTVKKPDGSSFALKSVPDRATTKWTLTAPMALDPDKGKAGRLTGEASGLEAVEYIDESPKADKLAGEYGLEKPRYTVSLGFVGKSAKPESVVLLTAMSHPGCRLRNASTTVASKWISPTLTPWNHTSGRASPRRRFTPNNLAPRSRR